jgi:glutamate-ammonia-ligase adenylyltransferase
MIFNDPLAAIALFTPGQELPAELESVLQQVGFDSLPVAVERFRSLCESDVQRGMCARLAPALLHALSEAATPDGSLLNFQRFVQCVSDRDRLFAMLSQQPRAIEILVRLFVGSQFLTEILLQNPHYLDQITEHKRIAEFKSREDFVEQATREISHESDLSAVMDQLRRVQQWELLRLAACDTFGLMDLKTVTLQLALLADALVQVSLECVARLEQIPIDDFVVLAFGKLGGEELNYSSDIDLVFVCEDASERFWGLGQKLIRILDEATHLGFLYRVDMRLRPWGSAGALVTTADAYVDYIQKHGQLWEKQALLKARPVAGNLEVGHRVLSRLEPFIFDVDPEKVRRSIREMKQKAEAQLARRRRLWGEVKSGPGGIRDIEFVTQFLQLTHGGRLPGVRSINTLDGLIRLSEHDLIFAEEFRRLTSGYQFLRTVEHALQLTHNKQEHQLPTSQRSLAYLARRLDFPDAESFVQQYELHSRSVREIFERYLVHESHPLREPATPSEAVDLHFGLSAKSYREFFTLEQSQQHLQLLDELHSKQLVRAIGEPVDDKQQQLTLVGLDRIGALSAICGLLSSRGIDIVSGNVFTGSEVSPGDQKRTSGSQGRLGEHKSHRKFVNVFRVKPAAGAAPRALDQTFWQEFEEELNELLLVSERQGVRAMQGKLARLVANAIEKTRSTRSTLLPVEIEVGEAVDTEATVLHIRGEDVSGFLYELTNAIAVSGLSIERMTIATVGNQVIDTLYVVDEKHCGLPRGERLNELKAAIVLIKHFTHLLPHSPNPESALLHFQEFLENLFQQPNWLEQLSPLHNSQVLAGLATLLGNSDFLWDDFLRLQHENLFPVVTNFEELQHPKDRTELKEELKGILADQRDMEASKQALNAFKDREMMRVDMRHILGLQDKFGMFGRELTDVVEAVVGAACRLVENELQKVHGQPLSPDGRAVRYSVCALGKCGGRELGYASDIELMFLYECDGHTSGPQVISNLEFFQRLVQLFRTIIQSRRKGIFEVDLRLRPYGKAGSLAVSLESFETYFAPQGAAWPYERQALVKLRPIAASARLGRQIVQLRDELIYRGEPFDVAAMRAMREKQIRQLVRAGTFNAKLSPGGLVDCEYLVQGLQITFGHLDPALREPNTREAMKALEQYGILTGDVRVRLRDAYRFWRRVIDALRVVRGDASDLTVPSHESDEFLFLSRRMGYRADTNRLRQNIERHTQHVLEIVASLEKLMQRVPTPRHES